MTVIGIDLGTSGVRATALAPDGTATATATRPTVLHRGPDGTVTVDPVAVAAAAEECLARVAAEVAGNREATVRAISFSSQGETVLPVDRDGVPLDDAIVGMDARGAGSAGRLGASLRPSEVHRITGQPLHPMFSVHKIAEAGGGWARAAGYRCLTDHLAQRWGLEPVIDWTCAARTGAFDVEQGAWSETIVARVAEHAPWLEPAKLSRPVPSGTAIGVLPGRTRERLGLPAGVVLAAGAHDQAAAYLGVGGRPDGAACLSFGSSDCLTAGTAARVPGLEDTGLASYRLGRRQWLTLAGTAAGGWAIAWFAELVDGGDGDVDALVAQLPLSPPDLLVLPYLAGSNTLANDPDRRGAILGLGLETSRGELARAFLEAAGYEFRQVVEAFRVAGVAVGPLHATGGGTVAGTVLQLRADASGLPLHAAGPGAALRGAALLARVALGEASLDPQATQNTQDTLNTRDTPRRFDPDPATASWYERQRAAYARATDALRPISRRSPRDVLVRPDDRVLIDAVGDRT